MFVINTGGGSAATDMKWPDNDVVETICQLIAYIFHMTLQIAGVMSVPRNILRINALSQGKALPQPKLALIKTTSLRLAKSIIRPHTSDFGHNGKAL
jgi:hypothetical protein